MAAVLTLAGIVWYKTYGGAESKQVSEGQLSDAEFQSIYKHFSKVMEAKQYKSVSSRMYFDSCDEFSTEDSLPEIVAHKM